MQNNSLKKITPIILSSLLLSSLSLSAEPVTTMVVNTSYKLYKYEHPWQKSKRVKLNNKFLSRIVIGKCDVRQWCEYQGGYVKEFWLKDKVTIDTDEQEKRNLESASPQAAETQTKRADKTSKKEETPTKVEEKKSKNEKVAAPAVVAPATALANTDKETTPKEQVQVLKEKDTTVFKEDEHKEDKSTKTKIVTKKATEDDLFFGVEAAYTMMSVTQKDKVGTITLAKNPATSGYGLNAEIGYNYRADIFATAEFNYQHYDDVNLYNSLLSLNKRFIYGELRPYVGVVGGVSTIQLTKSHTALPLNDTIGNQIAIGVQVGVEYMLETNLRLVGEYQLLKAEHKTTISSYPAEIELLRDYHSIFSLGVRW